MWVMTSVETWGYSSLPLRDPLDTRVSVSAVARPWLFRVGATTKTYYTQ